MMTRQLTFVLLTILVGAVTCDRREDAATTEERPRISAEPSPEVPQRVERPSEPEPREAPPQEPGGIMNCYVHGTRHGEVPRGESPMAGQSVTFELGEDSSLSVTIGEANVSATARTEGTTLIINDQSSNPDTLACGSDVAGRYRFRMSGSCVLTLEAVDDPCQGRRALLGGIVLSPDR